MSGRSIVIKDGSGQGGVAGICRVSGGSLLTVPGDGASGPLSEGRSFTSAFRVASLVDAGTIELLLIAPSEGEMQVGVSYGLGGDGTAEFFEGTTVSDNGNALTAGNRNRQSSNVATLQSFEGPTVTLDGALLSEIFVPGGTGRQNSVGAAGGQADIILAFDTLYLFRLTNDSGAPQPASVIVNWVENNTP